MRYSSFLLVLAFLLSCSSGTEQNEVSESESFESESTPAPKVDEGIREWTGRFYNAKPNPDGPGYVLEKNCWSKEVEEFTLSEFAGSPGYYYLGFNAHHAYMYQVTGFEQKGDTAIISAYPDEDMEGPPEGDIFKLFKVEDRLWGLIHGSGSTSFLVDQDDREGFYYRPCPDDVDATMRVEDRSRPQTREHIMEMLLWEIYDTNYTISMEYHIPREGIVELTPGPGLHPYVDTLFGVDAVMKHKLFQDTAYRQLLAEIGELRDQGEMEKLVFIRDDGVDVCMPEKRGIFLINKSYQDDYDFVESTRVVIVLYNENLQEPYTYLQLQLQWTYTRAMILKEIDATACEA